MISVGDGKKVMLLSKRRENCKQHATSLFSVSGYIRHATNKQKPDIANKNQPSCSLTRSGFVHLLINRVYLVNELTRHAREDPHEHKLRDKIYVFH